MSWAPLLPRIVLYREPMGTTVVSSEQLNARAGCASQDVSGARRSTSASQAPTPPERYLDALGDLFCPTGA